MTERQAIEESIGAPTEHFRKRTLRVRDGPVHQQNQMTPSNRLQDMASQTTLLFPTRISEQFKELRQKQSEQTEQILSQQL